MSNNARKRYATRDQRRQISQQDHKVRFLAPKFGVSRQAVACAMLIVGNNQHLVETYLAALSRLAFAGCAKEAAAFGALAL
jgi:hypothetical protein